MDAAPHPSPLQLEDAARSGLCVPCHECIHRIPSPDCRSCLGSGWIRPCGACLRSTRGRDRICSICEGRLFTAADRPGRHD